MGVSECQTTPVCASIHPASTKSQPPPSATNSGVAEDGGYSPLKGDSNLRHRRNNQGFAEHGRYTHRKGFPNLHHRRPTNHSPKTDVKRHSQPAQPPPSATNPGFAEHGSYRPLESVPNLRHRRKTIKGSPMTDVTHPKNGFQTSIFGDPRITRRIRRIRP